MKRTVSKDGAIELRCGDWREVLADVERCDAVVTDPPYGARTHEGHDAMAGITGDSSNRRALTYASWSPSDVGGFVGSWAPRCVGWFACMTSSDLAPAWGESFAGADRYDFVPLPCVIRGMTVRLTGDGPSSWCVWLMVARPRSFNKWGTLPGAYVGKPEPGRIGGKPLWLMRAIIRDYTKPGDLVVDPCAGGATTLIAAAMEGRRAIGAEIDPETFEKASKRIMAGCTTDLFANA